MEDSNKIKCYCFNKQCKSSIFSANCIITYVSLNESSEIQYCQECHKELVSKEELGIKIQLGQIFHKARLFTIIIDDDPIYHMVVKKIFERSSTFDKLEHYMDGIGALSYLNENKNKPNVIPDIIFIDVNMPNMDAWEFLNEFSMIYPLLKKRVDVYVMTNMIIPAYQEKVKEYAYVKGLITKNFDLSFLNNIEISSST